MSSSQAMPWETHELTGLKASYEAVSVDLASQNMDSHLQLGAEAGRYLCLSHSRDQSVLCYRPISYELLMCLIVCRVVVWHKYTAMRQRQ